ncbi:MAG: hypothetical protein O3B09_04570, partial [Proteobacteria bacterium]|nr:hypothetical protein [Pseudomonadota bacterium]
MNRLTNQKILFIIAVIAVGLFVFLTIAKHKKPATNNFSNSPKYQECAQKPNQQCLINLAKLALPKEHKFQELNNGLGGNFIHSGEIALVQNNISQAVRPYQIMSLQDAISAINLQKMARQNPDSLAAQHSLYKPYHYQKAALWTLHGYYQFSVGSTYLLDAQKVLFQENGLAKSSPELDLLIKYWRIAIDKQSLAVKQYHFTQLGKLLLEIGDVESAKKAALQAVQFPLNAKPRPLVNLLKQLGEIEQALAFIEQIENKEDKIGSYISLAKDNLALLIQQQINNITSKAEELIFAKNQQRQYSNHLKDLILINKELGELGKAQDLSEQLYQSVINNQNIFSSFNLIDAAWGFYYVDKQEQSYQTIQQALAMNPNGDKVIGIDSDSNNITYEDMGLGSALINKAMVVLCHLNRVDEALKLGLEINDQAKRSKAAEDLYECLYSLSQADPTGKKNSDKKLISPKKLAQKLQLKSDFNLRLLNTQLDIANGVVGGKKVGEQLLK